MYTPRTPSVLAISSSLSEETVIALPGRTLNLFPREGATPCRVSPKVVLMKDYDLQISGFSSSRLSSIPLPLRSLGSRMVIFLDSSFAALPNLSTAMMITL